MSAVASASPASSDLLIVPFTKLNLVSATISSTSAPIATVMPDKNNLGIRIHALTPEQIAEKKVRISGEFTLNNPVSLLITHHLTISFNSAWALSTAAQTVDVQAAFRKCTAMFEDPRSLLITACSKKYLELYQAFIEEHEALVRRRQCETTQEISDAQHLEASNPSHFLTDIREPLQKKTSTIDDVTKVFEHCVDKLRQARQTHHQPLVAKWGAKPADDSKS